MYILRGLTAKRCVRNTRLQHSVCTVSVAGVCARAAALAPGISSLTVSWLRRWRKLEAHSRVFFLALLMLALVCVTCVLVSHFTTCC